MAPPTTPGDALPAKKAKMDHCKKLNSPALQWENYKETSIEIEPVKFPVSYALFRPTDPHYILMGCCVILRRRTTRSADAESGPFKYSSISRSRPSITTLFETTILATLFAELTLEPTC